MPFNAVFDATTVAPRQGGGAHPVGNKFPFTISMTEAKPTKAEPGQQPKGGLFAVTFASDSGSIIKNYNMWNESEKARHFAMGELSALCKAVGVTHVDFKNDGASLRGAVGLMDVNFQDGHEPSAEKPNGGYVEVKKIYDKNGNDPCNMQSAAPQQNSGFTTQAQAAPSTEPQPNPNQPQVNAGWNGGGQAAQVAPVQQVTQQSAGWQQGATGEAPPWK